MKIAVGETVDGKRTLYLSVFTADGLLSTGGADTSYEGPALSAPTILYQHNLDGWVGAGGTFTAGGNGGEASYVLSNAETGAGLSRGALMLRVIDAGFRTQTWLVTYGQGIQPGDTDPDARRIYFFVYTDDQGFTVGAVPDQTFTADNTTDTCTATAHTYKTTDGPVRVSSSGGLPAGLAAGTDYWIIRASANTFKLATSIANALAGTAVNITTNGTGTQTISARPLVGEVGTDASLYQAPGSSTTAFLAGVTLEYEHNTDGWVAAGGTISHVSGDLWAYDPTTAESGAGLERGTIAMRATCTGFRTIVARVPFGETGTVAVAVVIPPPPPPPVGTNVEAYARMMMDLFPLGRLWRPIADLLTAVILACADELGRLDARTIDLLNEADPRDVDELLPEYERELGLPSDGTNNERQARVVAREIARQGFKPVDFQTALASLLDQDAADVDVIERTHAFADSIGDDREIYRAFIYRDPSLPGTYFVESAQTLVDDIKPSHTIVTVIESIAAKYDDPHTLYDRDLMGV